MDATGGCVISSVWAAAAVVRAASGGAGGARPGMAGIFALVRTARASLATHTCQGARAAQPNPSRISFAGNGGQRAGLLVVTAVPLEASDAKPPRDDGIRSGRP